MSGVTGLYELPVQYTGRSSLRATRMYAGDLGVMTYDPFTGQIVFHDVDKKTLNVLSHSQLRYE